DENVVADSQLPFHPENGADNRTKRTDLDQCCRAQLEKRALINACVAADANRMGTVRIGMQEGKTAVKERARAESQTARQFAGDAVVGTDGHVIRSWPQGRSGLEVAMRAGFPAATAPAGTSRETTAPAATVAPLPICTPFRTIAPIPIQTSSSMTIGFVTR